MVAALGLLLLLLVVYLAAGDNPWHDGIAKRLRKGDPVRSVDYAATYGWIMAAINAVVVLCLLLLRKHWLRPGETPTGTLLPSPSGNPRAFGALLVMAVVAAGVLAAPRLDDSLWGDEEWTVRRAIDGAYYPQDDGSVAYEPVGWRETFFDYRKPSNHMGFTVPARASLLVWRLVARPELSFVNEAAVRMPAFLAGLGAVASLGLLLRRLGFPAAGLLAAWLLAIHPWALRYASEARGYSLLVLGVPLSLLLLLRAVERASWGRFAAYGVVQAWMMWTWPPIAFHVGLLNVGALALLLHTHGSPTRAPIPYVRIVLVGVLGALVWLQLMLGSLIQLGTYMDREMLPMNLAWIRNLLSHLVAGVGWTPDWPEYHELSEIALARPVAFWAFCSVTAAAWVLGLARLLVGGTVRAVTALVMLLPAPLLLAWSWQRGAFLNHWYLIFLLPSCVAFVAVGLETAARALPRSLRAGSVAVVLVAFFAAATAITVPARVALRAGSLQPMRESVALTRSERDPAAPSNREILTASFQRPPTYYDPLVIEVYDLASMQALMARADREGRPLFVNYGRPGLAQRRHPDLVALMERADLFERVAYLPGFEPRGIRLVYRYRGAAPVPSTP